MHWLSAWPTRKLLPMCNPDDLLENNRHWAEKRVIADPDYFTHLSGLNSPEYMWIGCSDSRVPANEIIGLEPGRVFVHRNVANQVHHTDLNVLSAIQYAVEMLGVEHIIVTGHYDCGGVRAALDHQHLDIVDGWIRSIRDTYMLHEQEMIDCPEPERLDRLCELNVIRQVNKLCHTRIVQNAWEQHKSLSIHGWIYRIKDGLLHDLNVTKSGVDGVPPIYRLR